MPVHDDKLGEGSRFTCPKCNHLISKVLDTRYTTRKQYTRRRRKCAACLYKFTTVEMLANRFGSFSQGKGFVAQTLDMTKRLQKCQVMINDLNNEIQNLLDTIPK